MAGFLQQLKILLWRNILLKKRNRGQLFQELFFPVYFVAILAVIRITTKPETKPARTFPPHDVNSTDFGQPFTTSKFIYGTPNTTQYQQWMQDVVSQLNGPPKIQMFGSEKDLEDAYKLNPKIVTFGVVFNYKGNPNSYAIRTKFEDVPDTKSRFDFQGGVCRQTPNATDDFNCEVNKYMTSGYIQLQLAIENLLMKNLGVSSAVLSSRQTSVQLMDMGEFEPDSSYIQTISSIYFVFSFCILASYLAINIVAEKEKKIKDGMMMMGLNSNVFWLSWSIIYMAMVIFSAILMIVIIVATGFFKESNMFLLFIMFVLYGCSFVALGFMLTPFFDKARVAGAAAAFSTLIVSLLYLIVTQTRDEGSYDSNVPAWSQWLMCLLSPIAFATCMDQAIYLDLRRGGFNFDDSMTYGKFPLYAPVMMMAIDTLLYALLTVYFDKVIPGEYGVRYSPLFFLEKSYWFPAKDQEVEPLIASTRGSVQSADMESVPRNMESKIAMKVSSLSKSFKVDEKVVLAVNDFSLDIYEGQITCLLGHNGAGKTTLMNILTGVIPPTSGSARIMGLDITVPEQMQIIRRSFGICPQHNILYDTLSCKEHLMIFANIKGVPPSEIEGVINQALKDVDLETQVDTFAKDLSGGQKRKLSVAIALIGDPKIIFLDEPTAGMDPYSRRHLWSLLKRKKEGRVVVLTTHFMDEADILADRKAFIRKGKLRCCGSSLFLKNKFGIGYHLTMVVAPNCDVDKVTSFLTSIIPGIVYQRAHGKEVAYTVPLSEVSKFSGMFGKLDQSSSELGIKSYGVSMTTLEEVFLKLEGIDQAEDENDGQELNGFSHGDHPNSGDGEAEAAFFTKNIVTNKNDLLKQQFKVLFWIRLLHVLRNKRVLMFQVFVPVILVVVGLVLIKTRSSSSETAPEALTVFPNFYANSSLNPPNSQLPGLLVFDSLNTADSKGLISDWDKTFTVNSYAAGTTNTSSVKPHFLGLQIDGMTGKLLTNFVALYNQSALHAIPAAVSLVTQTLLSASGIPNQVNSTSYPFAKTENQLKYDSNTMVSGILVGLAFIMIIPGFSTEVVRDREAKLRSQLRIAGVNFNVYWGSIYCMNFIIYLIPSLLIVILTLALQIPGIKGPGAIGALLVLFLLNIPFLCFFSLILSFFFNKADSCNAYLPFILNMSALLPFTTISIVDMVTQSNAAIILHYVFCFIDPPYVVVGGYYFIIRLSLFASYTGETVDSSSYFDPSNHTVVAMLVPIFHALWMYWLLRVLDLVKTGGTVKEAFPCFSKSINVSTIPNNDLIQDEDSDVKAERERVESLRTTSAQRYTPSINLDQMNRKEPVAYSMNLRKTFVKRVEKKTCSSPGKNKTKVAVRNFSLGVNEGEVLGLLGPNGAGKTTTLNMVIAETEPTCGKVIIGGHDIRSSMLSMAALGYCPQHDALWEGITLREHIICFAVIKGVRREEAEKLVDFYVTNMKLEEHKLKRSKNLSGGTKRKLSYILSILGNPNLVLMDEPSTGMDPQSKRFLWDTISSTFNNTNKGAILTTHYMEEADALCNRVGIMVNGQLKCIGSTQHLKDKFGSGYILEVKLAYIQASQVEESMDRLEAHLKELFPNMQQVERFMERAQYAIPKGNVKSLGATFASLEDCKQSHQLEEYNFSQSSLEQVFLHFAKKQVEEGTDDGDKDVQLPHSVSHENPGFLV